MKVLSVTSELYPLIKTGGLADVAGALPLALKEDGVEMRSLLPGYRAVMSKLTNAEQVYHYPALFGGTAELIRVHGRRAGSLCSSTRRIFMIVRAVLMATRPGADWVTTGNGSQLCRGLAPTSPRARSRSSVPILFTCMTGRRQ
jgi:hypothetical protein